MKLSHQPKFKLGDTVFYEVTAEIGGVKVSQELAFTIVAVILNSGAERHTFQYSLSIDPPQPYHYGSGVQFLGVDEEKLRKA